MLNKKIKGVGAATLDRVVAIIISATVLSGVIGGITWLYKVNEKERFINDLSVIPAGLFSYYAESNFSNIDAAKAQKAGFIPESVNTSKVGTKTSVIATGSASDEFSITISDMDYKLCMASGLIKINDLESAKIGTTVYLATDMPATDSSKISNFVSFFCSTPGSLGANWH
jgi:hypothetical protein